MIFAETHIYLSAWDISIEFSSKQTYSLTDHVVNLLLKIYIVDSLSYFMILNILSTVGVQKIPRRANDEILIEHFQ